MSFIKKAKPLFLMHLVFLVFSTAGIFSKYAGMSEFMSWRFIMLFAGMLTIFAFYSVYWQLLLSKYPLSVAYSNRVIVVVWGMLWGVLFFGERVSVAKIVSAALVIAGILVLVSADE